MSTVSTVPESTNSRDLDGIYASRLLQLRISLLCNPFLLLDFEPPGMTSTPSSDVALAKRLFNENSFISDRPPLQRLLLLFSNYTPPESVFPAQHFLFST